MPNQTLAAALMILAAMAIIAFIDQFVQVIARDSSLWTFHLLRSGMMWAMALLWLAVTGARLRVVSWRGVAGRSVLMATGMMIYFGTLGFLPVAQAAAGLFSAPIFVTIFSVALFGLRVGPIRVAAVLAGFAGVILVLAPDPATISPATIVPMSAGMFYALAVLATRAWCEREQALSMALGIFTCMAIWSVLGLLAANALDLGDGFLGRGWIAPTPQVWLWTGVQAIGSLVAVVLLSRAYLIAEASIVSLFEYSVLGFSALFGFLIWGDRLGAWGLAGVALIAGAGTVIALREGRTPVAPAR